MTSFVSETDYLKQRLSDIKKALRFFKKTQKEAQPELIDPVSVADDLINDLLQSNIDELTVEKVQIEEKLHTG